MLIRLLTYVLVGLVLFLPLHYLLRRLGFFLRPQKYLRPYVPASERKATTQ